MGEFRRSEASELLIRMQEQPERIIYVTGPRHTGKTTAALQALTEIALPSRYVSAHVGKSVAHQPTSRVAGDEVTPFSRKDRDWLVRNWQRSRRDAVKSSDGFVLVLDEIEQVHDWSRIVKGLWDADRRSGVPLRVVILGSANFLLQTGLSEGLTGRYEPLGFTYWSFREMSDAFGFDIDQYIYFGGSPGAAGLVQDLPRWREHVLSALLESAVERDILGVTRIRKPALFKQFVELGCVHSGHLLSYSKMLRRLRDAGNTTTLTRYLELLSRTGLLAGLEKYSESLIQTKASIPKLNVLNTAFTSAFTDYDFEEAKRDRTYWGRLVESSVGAHLLNSKTVNTRVRYWRGDDSEADFVLQQGGRLAAIEVRNSGNSRRKRGLEKFRARFPRAKTVVVGADAVPLSDFLQVPARHWFG